MLPNKEEKNSYIDLLTISNTFWGYLEPTAINRSELGSIWVACDQLSGTQSSPSCLNVSCKEGLIQGIKGLIVLSEWVQ